MREFIVYKKGLVVVDDVVPEANLAEAQKIASSATFKDVAIDGRTSIWLRNGSLNPQVGTTYMWTEMERFHSVVGSLPGVNAYPTGTVIDQVLDTARRVALANGLFDSEVGEENTYAGIVASLYKYKPGTRLVWHVDASYLGAFAMYFSGEWQENWGGYFAVEGDNPDHNELGVGRIISPRLNRMIVFRSGLKHAVLSVANDAGEARVGLSGFFVRKIHAEAMLAKYVDDGHETIN